MLVSSHVCHPSLANDNLSGVAVATRLANRLADARLRHTYRFVFTPGTIGALTWLARNPDASDADQTRASAHVRGRPVRCHLQA